jgi:hypothetical protein
MIQTAPEEMTIVVDGKTVEVIKDLEASTGLSGFSQILDLGVNLLDWVIQQQNNGFEFGCLDKSGTFGQLVLGGEIPAQT